MDSACKLPPEMNNWIILFLYSVVFHIAVTQKASGIRLSAFFDWIYLGIMYNKYT